MKKVVIFSLILFSAIVTGTAQRKKKQDQQAIKKMCGCFEVSFNFSETFNYSNDSLYKPSKIKISSGLEWAQLVVDENDKISIQHILQVGNPQKPMIVKHWRQDWLYENTDFYMFYADNNWHYKKMTPKEVKKQWTQKVYQVDDSPRYEGTATWVHVDGKSFWENTTDAPLPRREYTTRSDYNVTVRGNRHEITEYGWLHDQDNLKLIREDGQEDIILAKEKGFNTYKKVDDSLCSFAAHWWKDNTNKWASVRTKWDEVYGRNQNLSLEEKVNNKVLYKYLFSDEYKTPEEINKVIDSFVK